MANQKRLVIEIELNDDAELGTAVLFFQKLVISMSKFGLTYFKEVALRQDYKILMQFETLNTMTSAIKEYQEDQLKKRAVIQKVQQQEKEEVN